MKTSIPSLGRTVGFIMLALLPCLFTDCTKDPYPTSVSIDTPANGSTLTALSSIEGGWQGNEHEVSAVKLKISRYSDGKFWNGSSWGGSSILITNFFPGGWSRTTDLPSGDDPDTGLLPGYYHITAIEVVLGLDFQQADAIVAVGVTAPPVSGTLHAWGYNGFTGGGLGAGPGLPEKMNSPVQVFTRGHLEGKNVLSMDAGSDHSLAVTSEGRVYAWGDNGEGQLGNGTTTQESEPVPVDMSGALNGKVVVGVAAGTSHSLAVTSDGLVYAWGSDGFGALGNNGTSGGESNTPVPVLMSGALAGKKVVAVAAGTTLSLALTDDGQLFAWGRNIEGQLGNATNTDSAVPVAVQGMGGQFISAVSAGAFHFVARTSVGQVYACGAGSQLGNGTTTNVNLPVLSGGSGSMAGKDIRAVIAGRFHNLALDVNGRLYTWGSGGAGALGTGGTANELVPVQVSALAAKKVIHVSAGEDFSVAATMDDKLYAWGKNNDGQLAGATALDVSALVPTEADFSAELQGGRHIQSLSCGDRHATALISPQPLPTGQIVVEPVQNDVQAPIAPGATLDFGTNATGTFNPLFVVLRNTGTSDLTDISVAMDGPDQFQFFGNFSQASLAPGDTTGFYIFFAPNSPSSGLTPFSVNVHVRSSDSQQPSFDFVAQGRAIPPGVVDSTFADAAVTLGGVNAAVVQADGQVVIGGAFSQVGASMRNRLARLSAGGVLDTGFAPAVSGIVNCIVIQPDGMILIGGNFSEVNGTPRHHIARLHSGGTLDTSFNPNAGTIGEVMSLALQADGKIIVSGSFAEMGGTGRAFLARLESSGSVDTEFNPVVDGIVRSVAVRTNGQVVIGGGFSTVGGSAHRGLARIEADGTVDESFEAQVETGAVFCVAVQANGQVLAGGDFDTVNGTPRNRLARLLFNGALDVSFDPDVNNTVSTLALQANGDMLVGGVFTTVGMMTRNRVARCKEDGSVDFDFDPNADGPVASVVLQADGKVLLAGSFTSLGGVARGQLARLTNLNATQSLTVPTLSSVEWWRDGGSPEIQQVTFDISDDGGASWTPLGPGTRVSFPVKGWRWSGGALPAVTGHLRARAFAIGGQNGGSSSLVETITPFNGPPELDVVSSGGVVHDIFSNNTRDFGIVATGSGFSSVVFTLQNNGGGPLTGLNGSYITGAHAASFSISTVPAASVAGGSTTSLIVTFAPRISGPQTAVLHLTSMDADENPFDITLNGFGGEPITTWKQRHFGDTTNAGMRADTADMGDRDGNSVLAEYALNLDPNVADQPIIRLSVNILALDSLGSTAPASSPPPGDFLFFTYSRNKLALADVIFQVEWSSTLATNDWHTTDVSEQVISEVGNVQEVQATVPRGEAGRRFVRLKMTRP